jgi:type IV secretion system protein VirB10
VSERANNNKSGEKPTPSWNSPGGLDLNPRPPQTVRISRRASLALIGLALILLGLFAYGGWKRRQRQVAAFADANLPKSVAPATAAAADIVKDVPAGNVLAAHSRSMEPLASGQLQAPEEVQSRGQLAGQPSGASPPNVYVRQAPTAEPIYIAPPAQPVHQPSPEEQRIQAAYDTEQRAIAAPTALREGFANSAGGSALTSGPDHSDSTAQLVSALQSFAPSRTESAPARNRTTADPPLESNSGPSRESFLTSARTAQNDDYLRSTRTAPLSQYEIKAGWEIPAVMEQGLNSDLPGEVKALVVSNVYDTATGRYVLIPQGARLVGEYNS